MWQSRLTSTIKYAVGWWPSEKPSPKSSIGWRSEKTCNVHPVSIYFILPLSTTLGVNTTTMYHTQHLSKLVSIPCMWKSIWCVAWWDIEPRYKQKALMHWRLTQYCDSTLKGTLTLFFTCFTPMLAHSGSSHTPLGTQVYKRRLMFNLDYEKVQVLNLTTIFARWSHKWAQTTYVNVAAWV